MNDSVFRKSFNSTCSSNFSADFHSWSEFFDHLRKEIVCLFYFIFFIRILAVLAGLDFATLRSSSGLPVSAACLSDRFTSVGNNRIITNNLLSYSTLMLILLTNYINNYIFFKFQNIEISIIVY